MSQNGNTVSQVQKPLAISKSILKRAGFMMEILRVQGVETKVENMLDGRIPFPETFTRTQMNQIALEIGDEYFIRSFGKQKTGKGLNRLAAKTWHSVTYYQNLMENPPRISRFGERITKSTNLTCKSVQGGELFDPKAYTAPDGEIHYTTGWLADALLECDRKMGRAMFLARAGRVAVAPEIELNVLEESERFDDSETDED